MTSGTGREFMERTRYRYLGVSDQMKGLSQPPLELPCEIDGDTIELPEPGAWEIVPVTLYEALAMRRSVRNFLNKPVEREKIMACLEAARLAPSASNSQPWSFLVVDDPAIRDRLCKNAFSGPYFINSFCKKAPVILVVISEQSKFLTRIAAVFRGTQFYLIDIGISVEHFVLQAEESGLGTCWIGWFNEDAIKELLNVPKGKKIDVLLALGYPDPKVAPSKLERETIEKMSSFNSY